MKSSQACHIPQYSISISLRAFSDDSLYIIAFLAIFALFFAGVSFGSGPVAGRFRSFRIEVVAGVGPADLVLLCGPCDGRGVAGIAVFF